MWAPVGSLWAVRGGAHMKFRLDFNANVGTVGCVGSLRGALRYIYGIHVSSSDYSNDKVPTVTTVTTTALISGGFSMWALCGMCGHPATSSPNPGAASAPARTEARIMQTARSQSLGRGVTPPNGGAKQVE